MTASGTITAGEGTLFDLRVSAFTHEYFVSGMNEAIRGRRGVWLTVINVAILVMTRENSELRQLLETADYRVCEGAGLFFGSKVLGATLPQILSGPHLFFSLLEESSKHGHRVFFLGSTDEVVTAAVRNARNRFPGINIVGYRSGYFTDAETPAVVDAIREAQPDLLFVGMGFPRERIFIHDHRHALPTAAIMDVGGAFTVLAGIHRLPPAWVTLLGLGWFYRMAQEPRRLWKRYLTTNTVFACLLARHLWKRMT
jgi:N-acetylglucosaminyldiphosphoundecaprenol N-acetyl-beta-D-mannosaminyltransferase